MKVNIDLNKANITAQSVLGNVTFLGAQKTPRYVDNKIVDGEYSGAIIRVASELQGTEIPLQFNFYDFGSNDLAVSKEHMAHILNVCDTLTFLQPVEIEGFKIRQATETVVRNKQNDETGVWEKTHKDMNVFDVSASNIKIKDSNRKQ